MPTYDRIILLAYHQTAPIHIIVTSMKETLNLQLQICKVDIIVMVDLPKEAITIDKVVLLWIITIEMCKIQMNQMIPRTTIHKGNICPKVHIEITLSPTAMSVQDLGTQQSNAMLLKTLSNIIIEIKAKLWALHLSEHCICWLIITRRRNIPNYTFSWTPELCSI